MQNSILKLALMAGAGFLALAVVLIAAGSGAAQVQGDRPNSVGVTTQTINLQDQYQRTRYVVGRVEAVETTMLGFDRSGQLAELLVQEGDKVTAGQLLATLEESRLQAQIEQAKSAVNRAKAEAKLAQLTKDRIESVVTRNLESGQRLDEAEANLDIAQAAVVQAEAALGALQVEQDKSRLYAPYVGTIVRRHTDSGAVLMTSAPVYTLQAETPPELRVALPAQLAETLRIGDEVAIKDSDHKVKLVRFVAQQNSQTLTQDGIFAATSDSWQPLSGEVVTLTFDTTEQETGVWLPLTALNSGIRGMWTVFVVTDEQPQRVATRMVSVIYTDGERAFLSGALSEGDQVVVEGTHRMVPKQLVHILED